MDTDKLKIIAYSTAGSCEKDFIDDIFQTALTGKNFLELGTGYGSILMPIAIAAQANGGNVITVDVDTTERTPEARRKINTFGLEKYVEFITADDRDVLEKFPNESFDMIAIDTLHTYYHTLTELVCYHEKLKKNGYFILHDTGTQVNKENGGLYANYGVRRAIETFLKHFDYIIFKDIDKGAGLMILKKEG